MHSSSMNHFAVCPWAPRLRFWACRRVKLTAVGLDIEPKTLKIRGRVDIVSYPELLVARLNVKKSAERELLVGSVQQRRALMRGLIEQRGLRAQLRSGNLITGQLFVAFDFFPDAAKAKIDWGRDPVELPVVPSTGHDIETKITGIVAKLDKLPYEAIGADLTKALSSLNQTLQYTRKAINRIDSDLTPN
ncbi:MAG: hypothetical protein ACTHMB_23890, partial [Candidatus Binatia bacterium]